MSERLIRAAERDLALVEEFLFGGGVTTEARLYLLKEKKEHLIRGAIIDMHLLFDDFLTQVLRSHFLEGRSFRSVGAEVIESLLVGNRSLRFLQKLALARACKWITKRQYDELEKLNSVRNNCGHVLRLDEKKRRRRTVRSVLRYEGKDLFETRNFIEFLYRFNELHKKMWSGLKVVV